MREDNFASGVPIRLGESGDRTEERMPSEDLRCDRACKDAGAPFASGILGSRLNERRARLAVRAVRLNRGHSGAVSC